MISEISSKCSKRSIWSEISPMAFILRLKLFLLALFFKIHAAMSQTWVFDLYSPMFCCFLCNSVLSFFKPLFSVARPVFKPYIYGFSAGEKRQLSLLSTVVDSTYHILNGALLKHTRPFFFMTWSKDSNLHLFLSIILEFTTFSFAFNPRKLLFLWLQTMHLRSKKTGLAGENKLDTT